MSTHRPMLIALASLTPLAALPAGALAAQVSGPDPEVQATVDAVIDAGAAGDMRKLTQQYAPGCVFIDEFAPFLWSGPGAVQRYFMSGGQDYQETQHRDDKLTLRRPAFVYVSGDRALVVEALGGTATVRGKPYASEGAYAFTLARIDGRWKITSQTWTKSRETVNPY